MKDKILYFKYMDFLESLQFLKVWEFYSQSQVGQK